MNTRVWMEVDLSAIRHNAGLIKEHTGRKLLAVVKANGYGQGAAALAGALAEQADYFGVANPEEGLELRKAGIKKPILVFGPARPSEIKESLRRDLTLSVAAPENITAIRKEAEKQRKICRVHLKVDTGMGRLGLLPEAVPAAVEKIRQTENLLLEGIYSHFSTAGAKDRTAAENQLEKFKEVLRSPEIRRAEIPLKHMASSEAIWQFPQSFFDLVRPGLMLFGTAGLRRSAVWTRSLKPALTLKTRLVLVREIPKNSPVSYGGTFITRRKSLVGVLPIGYADGYNRQLSNQAQVLRRNKKFPVIGRVCMDMTLVDFTGCNARSGDEIILMGGPEKTGVMLEELAELCGTDCREILTGLGSKRVKKVYLK